MRTVRTVTEVREAVRQARGVGKSIGFVPTMGALHAGHVSLLHRAREGTSYVVISVFVNPTQFNDPADLAAYPRDEGRDAAMARDAGADLFFAPDATEMYPPGFSTTVSVDGLSAPMEGAARGPGHFRGVATVVTKLFNIVTPDIAYFGQKDAQQAVIIRRLARDLDLPLRVEVCPTVREPDGLAMSSRNVRLGPADRLRALALRRGLDAAEASIAAGERDAAAIARAGRDAMHAHGVKPEYFDVVSADTLEPLDTVAGEVLVAVAARVGPVRLIDNVVVSL
ncbi:MAG: pantoate--beta-alanine ligase [Gemmatimonadota bacterium]|nr:pantoate--beta-alanine ligase [Gemmatimonadota bacterium]